MAYHLTEENIKRATLSFLKNYYKNNSSRGFGDTVAKVDVKAGEGIIADGYLKFSIASDPIANLLGKEAEQAVLESIGQPQKTKKSFLATFEATSQKTAKEIQYRIQKSLLIFDAIAIASMAAALSYGYNYMNDQFTLNQLGTIKFIAGFFGVMLASMIVYMLIFKRLSRYHHIHALAQFKRYHADEQWVSYGEDVFANPDNKYLLELKKQCIQQGFGLIAVGKDLDPYLVITPARKNQKNSKRKIRNFVEEKTKDSKAFSWVNGIKIPTFKSPIDTSDYKRFTKSYWKQSFVIIAMLFVMGEIYLEELKNPNIVYVDQADFHKQLKQEAKNNQPEPRMYMDDEFVETEDKVTKDKKTISNEQKPTISSSKPKTNRQDALIISTTVGEYVSYGCNRIAAMTGQNFLVQIGTAKNSQEAIEKVKNFNENGFRANAVWLGCFLNRQFYVVYLDDIFHNKNEATIRLERYQKLLIAKNQDPSTTILRAIESK